MIKLSGNLILGSGSPRRKDLLQSLGFDFETKVMDFDESYPQDMSVHDVPLYLAKAKNESIRASCLDEIVITADTMVIHNSKALGKPQNEEEAIDTISGLAGHLHEVVTGVCISNGTYTDAFSTTTKVKMSALSRHEIEYYVRNFKPMDKAGSYAIQEWIGLVGVEYIEGSYPNVMGLPASHVYDALKTHFSQ